MSDDDEKLLLPGMRRYVGPTWTDGRGNKVEVKRQSAPFYGATIPVPRDKRTGEEIRIGPLRVLGRTDGRFIVYDERRPFAENTVYLAQRGRPGLIEAILEMVKLARAEGLPVPAVRPRRGRDRKTNARGSGA